MSVVPSAARPRHPLVVGLAIAFTHFTLNFLGHWLTPVTFIHSALWPGAGFGLAILIICGTRYWPAVAISSFSFGWWVGRDPAFGLVVVSGLIALVPALAWLRYRGVTTPLRGTRHVLDLLFVSVVLTSVVSALVIALGSRFVAPYRTHSAFEMNVLAWGTVAASMLFTAPLMLVWAGRPLPRWNTPRAIEAALLVAGLLTASILVYGGLLDRPRLSGLSYVAFPFLMWAALRFGLPGAAAIASLVIAVALTGVSHGQGIFIHPGSLVTSLLYADGFCITLASTGLLIGAAIDEARRSMRALAESEAAYRRLTAGASDGIMLSSADGRLLDVNPRACELTGYRREELIGRLDTDVIDPADLAARPSRRAEFRIAEPMLIERRFRRKNGSLLDVEVSATRLEDGRYLAIVRDISERKRADVALREALSLVEATLEATTDGILVVDAAGRIRSFNRKFVELWNLPDEILASRDDDRALAFVLDQLRDPEAFLAQVRRLYDHPEETSYDMLEFKDGRVYERYSQSHTVGGVTRGRVWSFRDITQRLNLESQLRHAQKMEAVGNLAGGVAHDFNNLLTAIMGHSSLLLSRMAPNDSMRAEVAEIHRASERAALLTRQLLTFSRQQVLEPRVVDLAREVGSLEQMLSRTLGETIHVVLKSEPAPLWIRADAQQLEQVVLNLAINARDAMPDGGTLTIETSRSRVDVNRPTLDLAPGDYARLTFQDTGIGMDETTRLRVFDPFFTTKERGRGTGLGLAAVYGIARQSGGGIEVSSSPGRGARFDLFFPLAAPEPGASEAPLGPAAALRGSGRVLLVEDEDMVRGLLEETLESAGFEVVTARNGAEAVEGLERGGPRPDILVTDVVMPKMSGPELARRLETMLPDLRVLFISGYTADELQSRVGFGAGVGFLQKPFSPPTLIEKVRELADSARRS
jgi:PAS domain S-box-containing protein